MCGAGLTLLSENVDVEVLDFFGGEHCVVATALDNDAAGHLEEHGALKSLVEVFSADHLSVVGQQDRVVLLHSFDHGGGQFGGTGTQIGNHGNLAAHVARHFGRYVKVFLRIQETAVA